MDSSAQTRLREQLHDRRHRLEGAISQAGRAEDLVRLLREVDSALERVDHGRYGECVMCGEHVAEDLLRQNPLLQYCLCELSEAQLSALQRDLELAARIQWALLPPQDLTHAGWRAHHRYLPAGPVSGDYCDLVTCNAGRDAVYALLGDVSGKGVAASLLMARLNALFRTLLDQRLPLGELVERANQIFSQGVEAPAYATLVCVRAGGDGRVEVCNAGHCPPLALRGGQATRVDATGFPVGIFKSGPYEVNALVLQPGDSLFLYTDGLVEARDPRGEEYGEDRLIALLHRHADEPPGVLAARCLRDLEKFLGGAPRTDDLTLMVVRREA
ncbi:MAG TPA: SpoIIE family protein phosphatase [Candidatus Saccharimonadales bacterium]|nr:SpoIIE family protein phosphatase [Candidatus Saccharimonadales bacterium]